MKRFFHRAELRHYILAAWITGIAGMLSLYFLRTDFFQNQIMRAFHSSPFLGYALFFLFGCLRGFSLIPSTYVIVIGLLLFPPVPLFFMVISTTLISSASVYYFSELLRMDEFFKRKYARAIGKIKSVLEKNELPIIMGWSFFPFVPTDVICYVCGTLRVNFKKFLFGIFVGETLASGIYIFLGSYLLRAAHMLW